MATAIRQLSAEQRSLVDELARAAFEGADMTNPSATVREDVTGTLQAAVADPDVAARLGRLTKAEQWSGFGDFGDTTAVFTAARGAQVQNGTQTDARKAREQGAASGRSRVRRARWRRRRRRWPQPSGPRMTPTVELSERQSDLAVARLRLDEMRQRLKEAERNLSAADRAYDKAKQASRGSRRNGREGQGAAEADPSAPDSSQPMAAFASARLSAATTSRVFVAR